MSTREPRSIVLRVMPLLLALWTLFVWVGRIRNLAQESGPILDASRWSLVGSVLFTALGVALLGVVVVDRLRPDGAPVRWAVLPLAGLTTVVWLARGIDIAIGDHTAGFIAVHLVLAVVSIGLAVAAHRSATLLRMGEPVTVIEKPSVRRGYVRFETNRSFTGMGHESYIQGEPIHRDRPADMLARALLETGKVEEVHVYAQAVSVKLKGNGDDASGLREIIEDLYIYYKPGVEVPTPESFAE